MATYTEHTNHSGESDTIEWPDWMTGRQIDMVSYAMKQCRMNNQLHSAKTLLELVSSVRAESGLSREQLAGVRFQQQRRDDIIREFIQRDESRVLCQERVEMDGNIYACGLDIGHTARYHAGLRGGEVRIWPVAVDG
jgi:hypothetical protein